jgi:hypothetical protein
VRHTHLIAVTSPDRRRQDDQVNESLLLGRLGHLIASHNVDVTGSGATGRDFQHERSPDRIGRSARRLA